MSKVIDISNLSKQYHLGEIGLREFFNFGSPKKDFWALKDVSFQVHRGEVLGIIGANGAGKSTLLKLISQITVPTEGRIKAKGKIASLLEVGTGMHPDLTGRENIFLNGAILGMTKAEVARKFDEIVDFAECSDFINTPLKRYSSGMKVRLGFAVAVHLEPDIIIIDEVLAVGDAAFQSKAIDKVLSLTSEAKRTVLFVSHSMAAVKSLCSRCIYLKSGQIQYDGDVDTAISKYLGYSTNSESTSRIWNEQAPGNELVTIKRARLLVNGQDLAEPLTVDSEIQIAVELENPTHLALGCTLQILSSQGAFIATTSTLQNQDNIPLTDAKLNFKLTIPANIFNEKTYRLNLLIVQDEQRVIFRMDDILKLNFVGASRKPNQWMGEVKSHLLPKWPWEVTPGEI